MILGGGREGVVMLDCKEYVLFDRNLSVSFVANETTRRQQQQQQLMFIFGTKWSVVLFALYLKRGSE